MHVYRFNLDPTATFRSRSGLWLSGLRGGDSYLTLTTVSAKGFGVCQSVYGVTEVGPESRGERRFVLVKATEADAEEAGVYTVALLRGMSACSCQCGQMGFRTTQCKHGASLAHLLAANKLPARQLAGA